jgi:hypothetical protein
MIMTKTITIFFLLSITFNCFSQLDEKDIIFDWKHSSAVNHSIDPSLKKYTPTIEEIELAKSISIKYIDSLENALIDIDKKKCIDQHKNKQHAVEQ